MSSIHFVGGEKGGTGKSVFSRLLCEWFLENSITVAALDTNLTQGSLRRAFGGLCQQVDLSSLESADQIMDRALGAERHVSAQLEPLLGPLTAPQDAELIPQAAEDASTSMQAPEIATPDAPDASPPATVVSPAPASPAVGTIINQGAQNWTEVGEDCLIHHVRCI